MTEHDKSFDEATKAALKRATTFGPDLPNQLGEMGAMVAAYYVGLIRGGMPEEAAVTMTQSFHDKIMEIVMVGALGSTKKK